MAKVETRNLATKRSLVTGGDPDQHYPVPAQSEFDKADSDYLESEELAEIGETIIEKMGGFGYLADLKLIYLWKKKGGSTRGKFVMGHCQRPKGLLAKFCDASFVITVSADHCRDLKATRYHIEAIVFHELCHTDMDTSKDIPEPRLVPHDYEGFCREVELYGLWKPDLEKAAKAFQQLRLL